MSLLDELPPVESPAPKSKGNGKGSAYHATGDTLLDRANAIPILDALAQLGCLQGRKIVCPGHGESHNDTSVAVVGNGLKCLHARCADRGLDGFYTVIDAVIAKRGGTPVEAAKWICEACGVPIPERHKATEQTPPRMPGDDEREPAPAPAPYDGGPWLSTAQVFEPLPPTKWIVPDLQIGPGRAACNAAYAYGGKTVAMQSAALAIATDRPIWGQFRHPNGLRVRHADQDQGSGTRRRYQRLARGMGITLADLGGRLEVATFPELYLTTTLDEVWLRACEGIDLMILDALRGFLPGVDENDSMVQAHLMRLAKFSDLTGCSFWLAHHFGKPGQNAKADLERLRGSSGIGAALGSVFVLYGDKDEPRHVSHVKGHPDACGKLVEDFYLSIDDVASADGTDIHWGLRVTHQTLEQVNPPESPKQRVRKVGAAILQTLTDYPNGLSSTALRPLLKSENALIPTALEMLAQAGSVESVEVSGRGGKHFVYRAVLNREGSDE